MKATYQTADRAIVEERIVRAVDDFYTELKLPYPMRTLAGRFASALGGNFVESIERLAAQGRIRVQYTPTGARVVWPATVTAI